MTCGVGANDLANVMSPSMSSKAINVRQAIFIAIIFEFAGAFFGGANVTHTIRTGIINTNLLENTPEILIYGMLAVLSAGAFWMLFASYLGLPVSITNAIVGAIVGFGSVVLGVNAIHWNKVAMIAISWISSPLIAGFDAYNLFRTIQVWILARKSPSEMLKRYIPFYLFLVGMVLSYMIIVKGLKHYGLELNFLYSLELAIAFGIVITMIGLYVVRRIEIDEGTMRRRHFDYIERVFALLAGLTACAMVFAHGSNDISIAVGPVAVVVRLVNNVSSMGHLNGYPFCITFMGCSGVVFGLFVYGRKVIETVGSGITALTPSRPFAAPLAPASPVIVSTGAGIPVSATQTLVGAVLGVGLARGIGALNIRVIRNILLSWIITLPAASLLTIIFFRLINAMM